MPESINAWKLPHLSKFTPCHLKMCLIVSRISVFKIIISVHSPVENSILFCLTYFGVCINDTSKKKTVIESGARVREKEEKNRPEHLITLRMW